MNNQEKIVQVVNKFISDNNIEKILSIEDVNDMFSPKKEVASVTPENVGQVIEAMFATNNELHQKIFPYIEFYSLKDLRENLEIIHSVASYIDLLDESFSKTNIHLIRPYSSEKFQLYKKLKELIPLDEFKELEEKFFKDIIENKIDSNPGTVYSIAKSILIEKFSPEIKIQTIENKFKSVLNIISAVPEYLKNIKSEGIIINPNPEEIIKIVFINNKDKALTDFFIQKVVEDFPLLTDNILTVAPNLNSIIMSKESNFNKLIKDFMTHTILDYELSNKNNSSSKMKI